MIYTGRLRPIMIAAAPIAGAPSTQLLRRLARTGDLSDLGGRGRIAGTVMVKATPDYPVWRRVRLFERRDNRVVREVWSDPATGEYVFDFLDQARRYVVIAYDHTGTFNAEIRDNVTPEAMP